jgi:hypothetical protein
MSRPLLSVPWFGSEEEWSRLLAVADDRADLPATHAEFVALAGRNFDALSARGRVVLEKVPIPVDGLVEWCRAEGRPIDGGSRAAFAAITRIRGSQGH